MVKIKEEKLIAGIGINDADYCVQKFERYTDTEGRRKPKMLWVCPFYRRWKAMIDRCYYPRKSNKMKPIYIDCGVCEEWLTFSNFKSWMETQDWEGNQLDKDLLGDGKLYSPDTCCFIPSMVNVFMTERDASRGKYLIGVDFSKKVSKFRARCKNPYTRKSVHLGTFETEAEAHQAWLDKKVYFAKMLASGIKETRVAEALIKRYENYRQVVT